MNGPLTGIKKNKMDDKEYLHELKNIRNLRLTKEEWNRLDDKTASEILEKLKKISEYSKNYRKNKIKDKLKDIDPYGEEDWGN